MNRKALSLLIAVVMLVSVIPAAIVSAAPKASSSSVKEITPSMLVSPIANKFWQGKLLPYSTGAFSVPLNEYQNVVGIDFRAVNAQVLKEALNSAPFYPRVLPKSVILTPNSTVSFPVTSLPSGVVNTQYLPPIGDQGYVGSCNAWSSTYYVWTYMMNWWRNNPHPSSASDIMNPTFTYNLINGGTDAGSNPWDAMNLLSTIGAVPLKDFPLYVLGPYGDPSDYAWVWPNESQWIIAPHNSGNPMMYWWQYLEPGTSWLYQLPGQWYWLNLTNDTQWNYTKALLANGYVLQTTINVLPSFNFLNHPDQFLAYLIFYANYSQIYANALWNSSPYNTWTVQDLLTNASGEYNLWATNFVDEYYNGNQTILSLLLAQGQYSIQVLEDNLGALNVTLNDTVQTAANKLIQGLYTKFIYNATWWNNATFYLSTYSINGEKWFLNHGFNYLFALANFEWMIHYIPLGEYSARVPHLNFYNYYHGWQGGHAVTIVGYNDTIVTPDGQGALVMVNSWGTNWGDNGYWYFSYPAIQSGGQNFVTYVNGILPVEFQIEWPVMWGGSTAVVYVPKAANYTPEVMAVVGIKHPVRGEVVDGVYGDAQFIPAGIPIGVSVSNDSVWNHMYLDFWSDYLWGDITNETTAADLPQDHPFPNSPMAFDISQAILNLYYYIIETNNTPLNATFSVTPHDLLKDNITGEVYNFTILLQTPMGLYPIGAHVGNVTIPDGGQTTVPITVPVVQYGTLTPTDNASVNFGNFSVDVLSIVPLKSAKIIIGGRIYNLSVEEGGYYYYATGIAQKLNLPAGSYTYKVVVTYPNGKEVALEQRTVHIKGPLVYIISPESTVYNTSLVPLRFKIVDTNNVSVMNVTVFLNGKKVNFIHNTTTGLYTADFNLTDGKYTLLVNAIDADNTPGRAIIQFEVHKDAVIKREIGSSFTVAVIGPLKKVTRVNITPTKVISKVTSGKAVYRVEIPRVNNVPSVLVDTNGILSVAFDKTMGAFVAGWNISTGRILVETTTVKKESTRKLVAVRIKTDVKLGENGVAVLAFKKLDNIKIYVWKDSKKIQLTTDENNPLGYYYTSGDIVFVVLKEDPTVEVDGLQWVEIPVKNVQGNEVNLAAFNFLYYHWYQNKLSEFNQLYQKAVSAGINETILQKVLKCNETAANYYQKAVKLAGGNIFLRLADYRVFAYLRNAYIAETTAVKILKEALGE